MLLGGACFGGWCPPVSRGLAVLLLTGLRFPFFGCFLRDLYLDFEDLEIDLEGELPHYLCFIH